MSDSQDATIRELRELVADATTEKTTLRATIARLSVQLKASEGALTITAFCNHELEAERDTLSAVIEEARAHCEVNMKFYYAVGMGDISAAYEGVLAVLAKAPPEQETTK